MTDDELQQWTTDRVATFNRRVGAMPLDQLREYARQLGAQVIFLAADLGATEWTDRLHLADVVEKHIGRMPGVAAGREQNGKGKGWG